MLCTGYACQIAINIGGVGEKRPRWRTSTYKMQSWIRRKEYEGVKHQVQEWLIRIQNEVVTV